MKTREITDEIKKQVIECYNRHYSTERTLNIIPISVYQYYGILHEAREKGEYVIPPRSPKPKPPKPQKVQKQHEYDVRRYNNPKTAENIEKTIAMRADGVTLREVAERLGVSLGMAKYYWSIAVYRGAEKTGRPNKFEPNGVEIARMRQLYAGGASVAQIAAEMGVCETTIYKYIKKNKWQRAAVKDIHRERVIYLYRCGFSYAAIARTIGHSINYVSTLLDGEKERRKPWTDADERALIAAVKGGKTPAEIAPQMGRSANTISQYIYLLRQGGKIPPSQRAINRLKNGESTAYEQVIHRA